MIIDFDTSGLREGLEEEHVDELDDEDDHDDIDGGDDEMELQVIVFFFQVCSALREGLEEEHRQRMEGVNSKFKPLTINDEPSRKV